MGKTEFVIDVDKIIDNYNKNNPDKRRLDRKTLAEELGVNKQLFSDWKNARSPKWIGWLMKLIEIGDCKLEDFVKKAE